MNKFYTYLLQFFCSQPTHRFIFYRFKETIINAKFGGHTEAIKRLLAQLPVPAQSHTCSPYFDLSLFSYDDKWISALERPRSCGDHPIRYAFLYVFLLLRATLLISLLLRTLLCLYFIGFMHAILEF